MAMNIEYECMYVGNLRRISMILAMCREIAFYFLIDKMGNAIRFGEESCNLRINHYNGNRQCLACSQQFNHYFHSSE